MERLTLTTLQKQKRLNLACRFVDWNRVIFSDEAKLGPVIIWASIKANGPFEIRILDGVLRSSQYVSILQDILPQIKTYQDIFMQDAAAPHRSAETRSWFANHPELKLLDWPGNSADINPMKNVFDFMKERTDFTLAQNRQALIPIIYRCWEEMREEPEYFMDLYDGMSRHMEKLIEVDGNFIDQ